MPNGATGRFVIATSQGSGDIDEAIGIGNGRKRILGADSDAFEKAGPDGMTRKQRRQQMRGAELGTRGEGGEGWARRDRPMS